MIAGLDEHEIELSADELAQLDTAIADADCAVEHGELIPADDVSDLLPPHRTPPTQPERRHEPDADAQGPLAISARAIAHLRRLRSAFGMGTERYDSGCAVDTIAAYCQNAFALVG